MNRYNAAYTEQQQFVIINLPNIKKQLKQGGDDNEDKKNDSFVYQHSIDNRNACWMQQFRKWSSDGKSASSGSGKIELEFFTQKREAADTFDKIISEFNASQEEIVVKQNIVPDSTSVLMSRAATGDLPDIIQVGGMQDSNTMQFMKEDIFWI